MNPEDSNPEDPSIGLLRQMVAQHLGMQSYQVPQTQGLMGPTGRVFPNNGGISTEISGVNEHPTQPGRYTFYPTLVPGQVDVGRLLQTMQPSQTQMAMSRDWARQNSQNLPAYGSIPEALAMEQWRHVLLEMMMRGRMGIPGQYGLFPNLGPLSPAYQ